MKRVKRIITSAAVLSLLMSPLSVSGQLDKKPPSKWTESEARLVLSDSPWGKSQRFITGSGEEPTTGRGLDFDRPGGNPGPNTPSPDSLIFRMCLLSAKPVREAISRRLLRDKRDERLDDIIHGLLDDFTPEAESENIVILVSCASKPGPRLEQAQSALDNNKTDDLKPETFLEIKGGKRVYLSEYKSYGRVGGVFIFPRLVDGEPLITDKSGELHFHTKLSKLFKLDARYKPKEMIYQGKLEY
ncbi:MAG TPA: hypothetical protein VF131_08350 [Blastocatellia bacterium]|nr:hypothetical protein [Blastocatellia bacterium]